MQQRGLGRVGGGGGELDSLPMRIHGLLARVVLGVVLGGVLMGGVARAQEPGLFLRSGGDSARSGGMAGVDFAMLGAGRSEVFAGTGPGPDLHVPVPFVMVLRTGESARFVGVLAPFKGSGGVGISLRETADGELEVSGAGFVDTVSVVGGLKYRRVMR